MKKSLLLSLALLTFASATPVRAELNIRIPTSVQVGAHLTAGTLAGAFSLLTGALLLKNINFGSKKNDPQDGFQQIHKLQDDGLAILAGLTAIASISTGIASYHAFKNAYMLLK